MQYYNLKEYVELLEKKGLLVEPFNNNELVNKTVESFTYNSNEAIENGLFLCKGANFKKEYLEQAINFGIIAYISEVDYKLSVPCILVNDAVKALAIVSAKYFNYPNKHLNLIGITGTKGKSTTSYYIKYILDEYKKSIGKKEIAIISSIDTYDGILNFESHITTPESYDLYNHFNNAINSEIDSLVMEVSSQALKYNRGVYDLMFDYGIFLNISEDHISPIEHKDFEDYFNAKLKMFKHTKTACVNLDDEYSPRFLEQAKKDSEKVITFSTKAENADVYAYDIRKAGYNTLFKVKTNEFEREFVLTMPGLFNVENALAAICVAKELGIPDKYIYTGLEKARSSGRMELYHSEDHKILVLVDYAHNKLSFEKLFESVKNEHSDRKITIIFGCPGKKAYLRRRDLGTIAGKNADKIYLVAEDPGYEPVEDINNDIAKYIKQYNDNYEMLEERGKAIEKAIKEAGEAKDKTIILITGKGNETRQKYGSEYLPCKSDVEYTIQYLNEYDKCNMKGELKK